MITERCNLYSTSLIAFKIYLSNRRLAQSLLHTQRNGFNKLMEILVQSAALYSFCLILSLATYIASSNRVLITVGATNPIIGIIFCAIVTRTHDFPSKVSGGTYFENPKMVQGSIRNGRQGAGVEITTHSEKQEVDSPDPLVRSGGSNSSISITELAGPSAI